MPAPEAPPAADTAEVTAARAALMALKTGSSSVVLYSDGRTKNIAPSALGTILDFGQKPLVGDEVPGDSFCVPASGGTGLRFLDAGNEITATIDLGCAAPSDSNLVRLNFESSGEAIGVQVNGSAIATTTAN